MSSTSTNTRNRSRQTCLNCRRKKVKCHGEQPSCSFCVRLLQKCVYPSRRWTMTTDGPSTSIHVADTNTDYESLSSRMALIESQLGRFGPIQSTFDMEGISPPLNGQSPAAHNVSRVASSGLQAAAQPQAQTTSRFELTSLPPAEVVSSTIDLYFEHCHNQPYCFFHEETFRQNLLNDDLPEYLILAVLAMAVRFSHEPFYVNNIHHTAASYASKAWKEIVRKSFDSEEGLDHRVVQAATLLALHDFTACRHETAWIKIGVAVSMAQALHLMTEPPAYLPFSAQEERRRTLWSIYLLDKMATCGRYRPSLFLDRTIQLQLPCSEEAFRMSTPEQVVTLENFPGLTGAQIGNLESLAPTVALASILSQAANYAFEHNKMSGQKPPWDHTSEYQIICSQLTRFETFFDCYGDIQKHILDNPSPRHGHFVQITDSTIFSYVLYQLCYCLLQHPFLLRHRLEKCATRIPMSFLAQTISSCSSHAQELTRTLTNARHAQYKASATFFSYASLVAGSIHGLFQHSPDALTRIQSVEALHGSLAHLEEKARFWKNSSRMAVALAEFAESSIRYSALLDSSLQSVLLDPADNETLYALCDYGTMSTNQSVDSPTAGVTETVSNDFILDAPTQEPHSALEHESYSGHIDGIFPQMFGHTDTGTMLDNFSSALGDFNGAVPGTTNHTWDY